MSTVKHQRKALTQLSFIDGQSPARLLVYHLLFQESNANLKFQDDFDTHFERVKKIAAITGTIGLVIGIGLSVAYLMYADEIKIRSVIL